ncbi:hypothetical protein ROSEINA2194_04453 [Roseburia inulinivorans DSM 16841]|uniref:Transposase (putative) YhgA-like domain-containing protein n=1 Tax=Roseburia inulinivorans DSM 16841 TaxID=622312 RepID=C0G0A4_9FIRM|nr:hypothetical protein ROSEINA2194_04453 [Roseburia inulinivorans DSM 16841]
MNLESQIVIFSCNQRTVKKTVLPISGGKKFMAKCKRNRNRAKRNFTFKTPAANRNYKDTVFRMLFSDRKNLLSLYNAVNQSNYKNPEDLEIVTLENAIYMGIKNDLAFIMDTNLYLYEHQSTYNPNMPLRDLFYICSEYQKLVDKKSLFSSTLQKIPAPNFIEFYNGSTVISDCTELRLSSAFECLTGEPKLELIVTVLNVNEGHNADLMQHCSMLKEYAQYVARVRHYASDMPLNEAVKHAVDECIREGILAEFLTQNRNEVISMSIFEYDKELEEKNYEKQSLRQDAKPDMKPDLQRVKITLLLKLPVECYNLTNFP